MELQQGKTTMKFLVIGDFHIPERADEIPEWIIAIVREERKKEKFDAVLCTGDLTDSNVIKTLEKFGPVRCVKGNMDDLDLPEKHKFRCGSLFILLLHGSGIHPRGDIAQLNEMRKRQNADVVIHGHTHKMGFSTIEGKDRVALFVNPGTATGAWGGSSNATAQTFVIMKITTESVFISLFENAKIKQEVEVCIRKKR